MGRFPLCGVKTNKFDCPRAGRALDPSTKNFYCVQCWTHHSVVMKWPALDDDWPENGRPDPIAPRRSYTWHDSRERERPAEPKPLPVCKYYKQGSCVFGKECWFSH